MNAFHRSTSAARVSLRLVIAVGVAVLAALCGVLAIGAPVAAEPGQSNVTSDDIASLRHQMIGAAEQYNQATIKLKESQQRLSELQPKVQKQQALVAKRQAAVNEVAAAAYQGGGSVDTVTTVMVSNTPETMLGQLSFLEYLSSDRKSKVAELKVAEDKLVKQQREIQKEVDQQTKQQQTISRKQGEYNQDLVKYDKLHTGRGGGITRATYEGQGTGRAAIAVEFAYSVLGRPYVFGAAGPSAYDCSGLTMVAWGNAGVSMAHSAMNQANSFPSVPLSQLEPGDLVFYYSPIEHVAIYIGNGKVIHAPTEGEPVQIAGINEAAGEAPVRAVRPQ